MLDLSFKLEDYRTIIYINGKKFRQCKYLLLDIPKDRLEDTDEINSIDEAAEALDHSLERSSISLAEIDPRPYLVGSLIEMFEEFPHIANNVQLWDIMNNS